MIWWRCYAEEKTLRKTKKREEKNETNWKSRSATRGFSICFKSN